MKHPIKTFGLVLVLAFAADRPDAGAQTVGAQPPAGISYLSQGRYLMFQGTYANQKGDLESGLVKFDSQTGMAWLLQPAPATTNAPSGFIWVPVKN